MLTDELIPLLPFSAFLIIGLLGPVTSTHRRQLIDLGVHERVTLAPLVLLVFWIGVYPEPLLSVMHASVDHLLSQVAASGSLQMTEGLTGP